MNAVMAVLFLCLAMVAYHCLPVNAFSSGAPFGACSTLSPDPVQHLAQPQSSPVPYTIDLAVFDDGNGSFTYQPGMPYQLTLSGSGMQFRGFLIQARSMSDDTTRVGSFSNPPSGTRLSSCSPSESGITHSNGDNKNSVTVTWTAPSTGTGAIRLGYAVVQVRATYWANQRTAVIQEAVTPTTQMPTTDATTQATDTTNTTDTIAPTTDATETITPTTDATETTTLTTDATDTITLTTDAMGTMTLTTDAMETTAPTVIGATGAGSITTSFSTAVAIIFVSVTALLL